MSFHFTENKKTGQKTKTKTGQKTGQKRVRPRAAHYLQIGHSLAAEHHQPRFAPHTWLWPNVIKI